VKNGLHHETTFRGGRGQVGTRRRPVSLAKVMRLLVTDCIRNLSLYDTYRGVCRLSYFPYDVEPYFVPPTTAMAERRKQQGK